MTCNSNNNTLYKDFKSNDNIWRHVRFMGSLTGTFACDLGGTTVHATLADAVAFRTYLESPEGQQEQLQREERRRIRREFDIARDERRARMSAERNEWRLEVCPFFEDGLEVFA